MLNNSHEWFWFIVAGLAVYRASRMIAVDGEEGPFSIFLKWRDWVGQSTWFGRGFHCPFCVSVWAGLVAAIVIYPHLSFEFFLVWFGLSGFTVILHRLIG